MHLRWRRHWKIVGALMAVLTVLVGGVGHWRITAVTTGGGLDRRIGTTGVALRGSVALFADTVLHEIEISYDETAYERMIETYQKEGEKDWIQATVVVDGTRIENVGLRLKGNSSLFGVGGRLPNGGLGGPGGPAGGFDPERAPVRRPGFEFPPVAGAEPPFPGRDGAAPPGVAGMPGGMPGGGASVEEPERLPWLIQFDEFVDGRTYEGFSAVVIRSSSTATAANEKLALELAEQAGEPIQDSIYTSFAVNNSDPVLRLAVELPDDEWEDDTFETEGVLYKSLAGGDWSYRGEDPLAYAEAFDQETGKKQHDLAPLIDFLRFLNQSADAEFEKELAESLDINAFARYLALQDLLQNFDDIGGPGNNSYLRYDTTTGTFSVLTWDLNLAFSSMGRQPPGGPGAATRPSPNPRPTGMGRGNVLEDRFRSTEAFRGLYDAAYEELRQELFDDGTAQEILAVVGRFLNSNAANLVDQATQSSELDAITQRLASTSP